MSFRHLCVLYQSIIFMFTLDFNSTPFQLRHAVSIEKDILLFCFNNPDIYQPSAGLKIGSKYKSFQLGAELSRAEFLVG